MGIRATWEPGDSGKQEDSIDEATSLGRAAGDDDACSHPDDDHRCRDRWYERGHHAVDATISVTNDRLGRPTSVTLPLDSYATTTYGYSFTAPTRIDASGAYTMTVDKAGRITAIDDPLHTASWTFAYGADGAITSSGMPTTTALTTTAGYDALGRLLTRTTTPGPRAASTLTYNRAGNRLTEASTITGDSQDRSACQEQDRC